MNSLRLRLFAVLVVATGIVWLAAVVWISIDSRARFESILDRRLMEAARMVDSLFDPSGAASPKMSTPRGAVLDQVRYDRHLSCQIWSLDGRLVGASDGAPDPSLTNQSEGFSDRVIDGQSWRVFALADPGKGVRILVGDNLGQRHQLENGIVGGLLLTAAFVLPILALLIWLSVDRGLRPLKTAARDLAARDADNLERVDVGRTPSEIRPLVDALNRLFGKVVAARDHERSFLAYAAHELRTPLAGLKTQVQVAMAAPTAEVRDAALTQTLAAVDRSARLVQQLLAMSQLDANPHAGAAGWIGVEDRLRDLLATTDKAQAPERVAFSAAIGRVEVRMDDALFDLAMRNLMENALLMTPSSGAVHWSAATTEDGGGVLSLEDDGPGIAPAELDRVRQRFVRGSKRSAAGSGLGLAIVVEALDQSGAALRLGPRATEAGLKADIAFAPGSFRMASPRP